MPRKPRDEIEYKIRAIPGRRNLYLTWSEKGEPHKLSTGTADKVAAREFRRQYLDQLNAPPVPKAQTVSALLDAYLGDREGIVLSYDRLVAACVPLRTHFGDMVVLEVGKTACKYYRVFRDGKSPHTIRKELQTLSSAFSYGKREGWFDRKPTIELGEVPEPRDRWLSPAEAQALIDAAISRHVRLFILLALHTGARKGAILDLTWERVNFDTGLISYPDPNRPKTKKRRATVPMNAMLREALIEAREIARTEYVVEFRKRKLASVKKGFAVAVRSAGLEDVTPHVLRHTCATWMAMDGIKLDMIADFLAADPNVVWRNYRKFQPGYLQSAADVMESFLNQLAQKSAEMRA
jgi:integrase